ncbi:hypothetical protein [Thermotalea metallivorans]|uniref:Uncharacterized protein n=1 Tax=Thermotalea metallivorans TaxID=520762 RepID=A0A140L851_9FIRM|nr:hypothetical protein [Thermotalea metallivorans]KXG76726.1 hypothetical protein AN619_08760 [Thermotalea metallivorans]
MFDEKIPEIELTTGKFVEICITQDEVEKNDIRYITQIIQQLKELKTQARQKIKIVFSGWEEENKEIYEIEAIRKWMSNVFEEYPYMFYFLTNVDDHAKKILCCISDYEQITIEKNEIDRLAYDETTKIIRTEIQLSKKLKEKLLYSILDYCRSIEEKDAVIMHVSTQLFF